MTTNQFWANEPTILFHKDFIFEMWPQNTMKYEQKLNAISRLIFFYHYFRIYFDWFHKIASCRCNDLNGDLYFV